MSAEWFVLRCGWTRRADIHFEGLFPDGISVLSKIDFFAVGIRRHAFTLAAADVAKYISSSSRSGRTAHMIYADSPRIDSLFLIISLKWRCDIGIPACVKLQRSRFASFVSLTVRFLAQRLCIGWYVDLPNCRVRDSHPTTVSHALICGYLFHQWRTTRSQRAGHDVYGAILAKLRGKALRGMRQW